MRFLLVLGFLLGFGGVLAAASLAPYGAQERIRSRTSVANNGGRRETFLIRLPADRIVSTGGAVPALVTDDPASRIEPPPALAQTPFAAEQFKLRNDAGEVIGVAMRHWTVADGAAASTWAASIPGRGALVWTVDGDTPAELANALAAAGAQAGLEWHGELRFDATLDGGGAVVAGTEEFAETAGFVEEVWSISGVGGNGELRGTVTLDTVVNQSP